MVSFSTELEANLSDSLENFEAPLNMCTRWPRAFSFFLAGIVIFARASGTVL